jgi:type II secretory pathway component PulC
MKMLRVLGTVATLVSLSACGAVSPSEPKFIEDIRPLPPPTKVVSYSIQRRDLQEALQDAQENSIRLVPVYQSVSSRQSYEYRLFDVKPASAYTLLGLESSDIVVAADRFLIKRPEQFPAFVQLLAGLNEATIEIRRGGESRLFKYNFIPALAEK